MNLIAQPATVGALVVDSDPYSVGGTAKEAEDLAADGVDCMIGYLGAMTPARLGYLVDASVAFMPVTFGTTPQHYSGPTSVSQCQALGLPPGCSVWLDVEGLAVFHTDPVVLATAEDAWCDAVEAAGFMPCGYIGVPQPHTSAELYARKFVRYWHGQGEVRDRHNALAAPACGWCLVQKYPSRMRGGVLVDDDVIREDLQGRVPSWVVSA